MTTLLTRKDAIAPQIASFTAPPQNSDISSARSKTTHLVARWLRDDQNHLYCQWVSLG